tara:strand:+ start:8971 stop:9432 length:462 start_codon:yes stop_codon:yes gene_type:complete
MKGFIMKAKIPPPVIAIACIVINYLSTLLITSFTFSNQRAIGGVILMFGFFTAISAVSLFRKNRTTINPMKPEDTTTLITTGIFFYTRNPMYLGLLLIVISTLMFFGAWFGLIVVCFFIWYINTYQIQPEEEALQKLFGDQFTEYSKKVRRWF